jgi:hypothetical protein
MVASLHIDVTSAHAYNCKEQQQQATCTQNASQQQLDMLVSVCISSSIIEFGSLSGRYYHTESCSRTKRCALDVVPAAAGVKGQLKKSAIVQLVTVADDASPKPPAPRCYIC